MQAGEREVALRGHRPDVRLEMVSRLTEARTAGFRGCLEKKVVSLFIAFHYMNSSLQRKSLSPLPESLYLRFVV